MTPARLGALGVGLVAAACVGPEPALPFGARSDDCAGCHAIIAAEWAASPHARAVESPVFQALLPEVEAVWGSAARQTCEGCHAPGHSDEPAIGCVSCHAAVGNHGEFDGRLAIDLAAPLAGPFGASSAPTGAHTSTPRTFLTDAGLCGTCHEVRGPELFVEHTLSEHRASPAAAAGDTCVDCHAVPVEDRPAADGGAPRPGTDHRFGGVDPVWGGTDDEAAAATAATLVRVREALALEVRPTPAGREVVLTNVGAGHDVPTGVAFLRELRVDVELDGAPFGAPLRIGDVPTAAGQAVALPTDADAVRAGSLAPGAHVAVAVPTEGALVATLRFRAIRPEVLDALGLPDVDAPPELEVWRVIDPAAPAE